LPPRSPFLTWLHPLQCFATRIRKDTHQCELPSFRRNRERMELLDSRSPLTPEFLRYPSPIEEPGDGNTISPEDRPRTSFLSYRSDGSDATNLIERSTPLQSPNNRPASFKSQLQFDNGDGVVLRSPTRNFIWTWILTIVSTVWVLFTVYFAYNCTLEKPLSTWLIFPGPDNTILTLNVLSHGTIFLLRELASSVFEAVRWAFASSKEGISAFSFLGMSRATSPLGVLNLMARSATSRWFAKDGHRMWGLQRYVHH